MRGWPGSGSWRAREGCLAPGNHLAPGALMRQQERQQRAWQAGAIPGSGGRPPGAWAGGATCSTVLTGTTCCKRCNIISILQGLVPLVQISCCRFKYINNMAGLGALLVRSWDRQRQLRRPPFRTCATLQGGSPCQKAPPLGVGAAGGRACNAAGVAQVLRQPRLSPALGAYMRLACICICMHTH